MYGFAYLKERLLQTFVKADIFEGFLFKLSFDLNDLKGQFTPKEITHHIVPTARNMR